MKFQLEFINNQVAHFLPNTMRRILQLPLLAGLLFCHLSAFCQDTNFWIFLCFGQSNMEGISRYPGTGQDRGGRSVQGLCRGRFSKPAAYERALVFRHSAAVPAFDRTLPSGLFRPHTLPSPCICESKLITSDSTSAIGSKTWIMSGDGCPNNLTPAFSLTRQPRRASLTLLGLLSAWPARTWPEPWHPPTLTFLNTARGAFSRIRFWPEIRASRLSRLAPSGSCYSIGGMRKSPARCPKSAVRRKY